MHQRTELNRVARLAKAPSAIWQYGSERGICNAFLEPVRASADAIKIRRQRENVGAQAIAAGRTARNPCSLIAALGALARADAACGTRAQAQ